MAPTGAADVSAQRSTNRAADFVIQTLKERIRSGELKDGETLPSERDLMDEFRTSRTVATEAVHALSNRGLVEARPHARRRERAFVPQADCRARPAQGHR